MPPRKSSAAVAKTKEVAATTTFIGLSPTSSSSASSSSKTPDKPSTDAHLGLLIEYLTFNPRAFIDALVYVANEGLYKIGEEFEETVFQLMRENGETEENAVREAEKGTHSIRTLIENALDHVFDTLELYSLQAVFGLTPTQAGHMVLPHHEGLDLRDRKGKEGADESTLLSEEQRELTRKLNAAKATQHALTLALEASDRRLHRTRSIYTTLLTLIGASKDGTGAVGSAAKRLEHGVQVIKSNRDPLIANLEHLRALDPLGKALIHPTSSLDAGQEQQGAVEEDAVDQPWSAGREGYLRWQTQRMLASNRRSMGGATDDGAGDTTLGDASSLNLKGAGGAAARKRKSGAADESMRRASRGRTSMPLHPSADDGMDVEEVGKTAELEQLASLMQHRPATTTTAAAPTPASPARKTQGRS